jgi:hypothetical protein
VHQRGRRIGRIAGEEHGRSRHTMGWLPLKTGHERVERHLAFARLLKQEPDAAAPGVHHRHHHPTKRERYPAALEHLEQVGTEEGEINGNEGPDQQRGRPDRPTPAFEHHDESHHRCNHHGAAYRYAVSRGECTRRAEQPDEHENSDQKQGVDSRHVDLPKQRFGRVANFHARQEAEMNGLLRQRIGAGDHGLARDHGRGRGEHHHRQLSPIGIEQEEWVLDRLVISQDERTLAKIVDRQRRQNDAKPGGADWAPAEMPEISIKRFRAGDREKNGTERYQTVREEKPYFEDIPELKLPKEMLDLAAHIVQTKSGHFDPSQFEDRYENALIDLLKRKQAGEKIEPAREIVPPRVVNLMEALRASVDAEAKKAPAPSTRARRPAKKKATR